MSNMGMNFMAKNLVSIHAFRPAAVIQITGADALDFLQGQFTNDIRHPVGSAVYGLWLNQKGKVLADSEVLRTSDNEFLLVSTSSPVATILHRLEQYIIADDVILADVTPAYGALSVAGEGADLSLQAVVGGVPDAGQFLATQGVFAFRNSLAATHCFHLIGPSVAVEELRLAFVAYGCQQANDTEAEVARIEAGFPSVPGDIGASDLPQEAGLERTAISFTKGCYLGQEVMARLKNLGQVRRQLRKIHGSGRPPPPGAPLFQGPKKVGEVRSAIAKGEGFIALAMLTRLGLDEQAGMTLAEQTSASIWMR